MERCIPPLCLMCPCTWCIPRASLQSVSWPLVRSYLESCQVSPCTPPSGWGSTTECVTSWRLNIPPGTMSSSSRPPDSLSLVRAKLVQCCIAVVQLTCFGYCTFIYSLFTRLIIVCCNSLRKWNDKNFFFLLSNHISFNGKLQHNIVKKTQINPSHATVSIFKVWCCSFSSISTAYWILTLLLLHQYRVSRVPIVRHWTICAAGNCINLLFVPEINI